MKFKWKLLLLEVISLLVLAAVIVAVNLRIIKDEIGYRVQETLRVAVAGYTDDPCYLKEQGEDVEITVFEGSVRTDSSIPNVVGTLASANVINTVINKKQTLFIENASINGKDYYGYYVPTDTGMLFAGKPVAVVTDLVRQISVVVNIITLLVCFVCIAVTLFIAYRMSRSLNTAKEKIVQLSKLDVTGDIDESLLSRKDEFGDIGRAVNSLKKSLMEIVSELSSQAKELNNTSAQFSTEFTSIADSVSQVNVAMSEVSESTMLQASETTTVGTQTSNMADVIDTSCADIDLLQDSVSKMYKFSKDTEAILTQLSLISENVMSTVDGVTRQINVTAESVDSMRKTIEVIQGIAKQTNLLSINASIEAAHAGEAGKGFAVVAGEIKKLSDSSARSAKDVEAMAKSILSNTKISVDNIVDVNARVNEQHDSLKSTLLTFTDLQNEIKVVNDAVQQLLVSVNQLEEQKITIGNSAEQLAAISQENAAASEEVTASISTVSESVNTCKDKVAELATASEVLSSQIARFKI